MRTALLCLVCLTGCLGAHTRTARFVDGSEDTSKAWICVGDDDPTNKKGVACGDMGAVMSLQRTPPAAPDAGTSQL